MIDWRIGWVRAIGALCVLVTLYAGAESRAWLLIDTRSRVLTVMGPSGPLEVFDHVALGVRGAGIKRRRGDEITPIGSFRIAWINTASRFDLFFGLDYPNREHAALARYDGRIDEPTYRAIVQSLDAGRAPSQNTVLGGQIGIHGLGSNDRYIHANTDWTNGCIALTNEQIHSLARWIGVGTRVEIH